MSTCQISKISKSTCKQKINYDLKENQCQGCDFYLCNKHKPRHKCSKVKYQQQNEELKEQQEQLLDTQQDQEQQEIIQQNNNDYYSYNKDKNNNVIEYIPYEKKDKCYSNKVVFDKYGKIDKNNLKIEHEPFKKKKININSESFYNNIEEEKQEDQNQLQNQIQEEQQLEEFQQQQLLQEQLQVICEWEKQQFENNDDATCYEKYSYKQEINQKEIDNYTQQIADQQQKSWADNSYLKKKQIECYQNIDYRILLDEQKVKNNLHLPGKNDKDYNFESKKQSSKYQKILPLDVPFPEKPYEIKQDYAHKIVDALDNPQQENVLIQTPSGTGKTLSLLCSTLAFLKKHRDTIKKDEERYQIIYASQTIQQLNKVAKELKKTGYKLRSTILGSQYQMCINGEVKKEFNKSNQNNFSLTCQKACQSWRCLAKKTSFRNMEDISQKRQIIDIEDLGDKYQKFNINTSSCPYFDASYNIDTYDVILVPYSTLLDQRKMQTLDGINKKKQIIILDEAHNILEQICNGRSYKLDDKTLEKVINYSFEVEEKVNKIELDLFFNDICEFQLEQQIQYIQNQIDNSDYFGISFYDKQNLQIQIESLKNQSQYQYIDDKKKEIRDILQSVRFIQTTLIQINNNFMAEYNKNHNFSSDNYKLADSYDEMIAKIFQRKEDEIKLIDLLKNLEKVKNFVNFTKGAQKKFEQSEMAPFEDVIFFFQQLLLNVKQQPQYYKLMASCSQNKIKYVLQCLDSSFALKILNRFVDSTYILTSSQLSPFNIFLSDFAKQKVQNNGMKFNTHQFDKHIAPQQNFMGRIVNVPPLLFKLKEKTWTCPQCKNSNKNKEETCLYKYKKQVCNQNKPSWLNFTKQNTDPENKEDIVSKAGLKQFEELGEYFINILKVIKGGVLLVFPTFNHLRKCRNVWEKKSQYGEIINKFKKIFYQSTNFKVNKKQIQQYQGQIEKDGNALFVVVSKSKLLDTYEFKDDLNRAMFIVGTPGMQRSEGFIKEKLQYLEKQRCENNTKICEQEWFNNSTMREVNKNFGKIIRHKDDYGAVFLIDQFYSRNQTQKQITDWVKQQMKTETDFEKLVSDTKKFFSQEFKQVQKVKQNKTIVNTQYQNDSDVSTGMSGEDQEDIYDFYNDFEEEESDYEFDFI